MAKDTSMSKCPELESGCKRFVTIRSDKFRSNDGFMFKISVVHSGSPFSKEQITSMSKACCVVVGHMIESLDHRSDDSPDQLTFDF